MTETLHRYGWRTYRLNAQGLLESEWGTRQPLPNRTHVAACVDRREHPDGFWGSMPETEAGPHTPCDPVPGTDCRCGIYHFPNADPYRYRYSQNVVPTVTIVTPTGREVLYQDPRDDSVAITCGEVVGPLVAVPAEEWNGLTVDNLHEPVDSYPVRVWRAAEFHLRAIIIKPEFYQCTTQLASTYRVPVFAKPLVPELFASVELLVTEFGLTEGTFTDVAPASSASMRDLAAAAGKRDTNQSLRMIPTERPR